MRLFSHHLLKTNHYTYSFLLLFIFKYGTITNANGVIFLDRKQRTLKYDGIAPFKLFACYSEKHIGSDFNEFDSHIHADCEIYINVSGNVSFMVEDTIYPVKPGSIIITKPYEYHHCIYHGSSFHKHFWFLLSANGGEKFLDVFFNREIGKNNLLELSAEETSKLFELCEKIVNHPSGQLEEYSRFFSLIEFLKNAESSNNSVSYNLPDVVEALEYIGENFFNPITVADIAKAVNVSINTLERHFSEALNMTPLNYLRKKRFANAAKLLAMGSSVLDACEQSGFTDYSNFIVTFKKMYGLTPLKYKKQQSNKNK